MSTSPGSMLHFFPSQNIPARGENADKKVLNWTGVGGHVPGLLCLGALLSATEQSQKTALLHMRLHPLALPFRILASPATGLESRLPGVTGQSHGLRKVWHPNMPVSGASLLR